MVWEKGKGIDLLQPLINLSISVEISQAIINSTARILQGSGQKCEVIKVLITKRSEKESIIYAVNVRKGAKNNMLKNRHILLYMYMGKPQKTRIVLWRAGPL